MLEKNTEKKENEKINITNQHYFRSGIQRSTTSNLSSFGIIYLHSKNIPARETYLTKHIYLLRSAKTTKYHRMIK